MGPQLYRCGNPAGSPPWVIPREVMLQWGRNFIVAETTYTSPSAPSPNTLQWGRNFIVAETCFSNLGFEKNASASMGPQLYRCGNLAFGASTVFEWLGFNGAATLSLRKRPWGRRRRPRVSARFNGAATLSLRKRDSYVDCRLGSQYASMGPQLYRCGNYKLRLY